MRKLIRKWLGIDELDQKLIAILVEFGRLTPEQAEELASNVSPTNYKQINDHGEEGQL